LLLQHFNFCFIRNNKKKLLLPIPTNYQTILESWFHSKDLEVIGAKIDTKCSKQVWNVDEKKCEI